MTSVNNQNDSWDGHGEDFLPNHDPLFPLPPTPPTLPPPPQYSQPIGASIIVDENKIKTFWRLPRWFSLRSYNDQGKERRNAWLKTANGGGTLDKVQEILKVNGPDGKPLKKIDYSVFNLYEQVYGIADRNSKTLVPELVKDIELKPSMLHTAVVKLSEAMTEQLVSKLQLSKKILTATSITTMCSSIVAFITSLFVAVRQRTKTVTAAESVALWATPIMNLISIAASISTLILVSKLNVSFDMDSATKVVESLLEVLSQRGNASLSMANAISTPDYVRIGATLLSIVITAGMTGYGWKPIELNALFTLKDHVNKSSKDMTDFMTDILDNVFATDLRGNKILIDNFSDIIERSNKLLNRDPADFIIDSALYHQLETTVKEISNMTLNKYTPEQQKCYNNVKPIINQNYTKLVDIMNTIKATQIPSTRQACVGVSLEGLHGIGKSELAKYIISKLADKLGYNRSIYDLKPGHSGNYHQIYGKQSFALVNEMGATRDISGLTESLNSIISSDAVNLEAAHLSFKHQPCVLKCVVMTGNVQKNDCYDFSGVLKEDANVAFLDRVVRYHLEDLLYEGREKLNAHRRDDFSHLKVYKKDPAIGKGKATKISDFKNNDLTPTTIDDMVDELCKLIAMHEKYYLTNIIRKEEVPEPVLSGLRIRVNILDQIRGSELTYPDVEVPMRTNADDDEDDAYDVMKQPEQTGTNFFVVRYQGPMGVGKSTRARRTAHTLSQLMRMSVIEFKSLDDLKPRNVHKPKIYILNDIDIIGSKAAGIYVNWINSIPKNSCVIITTNHCSTIGGMRMLGVHNLSKSARANFDTRLSILNPRKWYHFWGDVAHPTKIHHINSTSTLWYPENPGIYRRMGLGGLISTPYGYVVSPVDENLCITLTQSSTVYVNDVPMQEVNDERLVVDAFLKFYKKKCEIVVVHTTPPIIEPDVAIIIKKFDLYKEEIKTVRGYVRMFQDANNKAGRVIVKPGMENAFLKYSDVNTWKMPYVNTFDDIKGTFLSLIYRLRAAMPDVTVTLVNQESGEIFLYSDGFLYCRKQEDVNTNDYKMDSGILSYKNRRIEPSDIASFIIRGMDFAQEGSLVFFEGYELAMIKKKILNEMVKPEYQLYRVALQLEKETLDAAIKLKNTHPIVKWMATPSLGRTLLIAISTTIVCGTTLYGTYKALNWLFSSKPVPEEVDKDDNLTPGQLREACNIYDKELHTNGASPASKREKVRQKRLSKIEEEGLTRKYHAGVKADKYKNQQEFMEQQAKEEKVDIGKLQAWKQVYNERRVLSSTDYVWELKKSLEVGDDKNAYLVWNQLTQERDFEFVDLLRIASQERKCNAVSLQHEITRGVTVLNPAIEKLKKAVCTVHSGTSRNYGLVVFDNYVLTTAHTIRKEVEDNFILWSDDTQTPPSKYPCEVVSTNRKTDLCILKVTSVRFPSGRNLLNMFPTTIESGFAHWSGKTYFVRPFNTTEVFRGDAIYMGTRRVPLKASNNAEWCPTDYITFNCFQAVGSEDIHRSGDCGLPLLKIHNNRVYIVGVHCAINAIGEGTYSPVFRDIIEKVIAPQLKTNSDEIPLPQPETRYSNIEGFEGYMCVPYYPELENLKEDIRYSKSGLDVLGYHPHFRFFSRLKDEKKFIRPDGCRLMTNKIYAIDDINKLTQEAYDFLPKDDEGFPDPLLAQLLKTKNKIPPTYDPELMDITRRIMEDEFKIIYGNTRPLRHFEAINGLLEGELQPFRRDTSAGPWMKINHKIDNKIKLFSNYNEDRPSLPPKYGYSDTAAGQDLHKQVVTIIDACYSGVPQLQVYQACPKKELLEKTDVLKEGKIREFQVADVSNNLAQRIILGDLLGKQHQFHATACCKLGMNDYIEQHYYMNDVPDNFQFTAIDVKRHDKNITEQDIEDYYEHAARLCNTEDHALATRTMGKSYKRGLVILKGVVIRILGSNKSGGVPTASLSSHVTFKCLVYTYVKQMFSGGLYQNLSFTYFRAYTRAEIRGDDLLVGYDPEVVDLSVEGLSDGFKTCGFQIISAKNFSDKAVEFCSRETVFDEENCVWVARLKKDTINSMIFWLNPANEAIQTNIFSDAMFEASLWDEEYFEAVKHDVLIMCKTLHLDPLQLRMLNYQLQRQHFAEYVRGQQNHPVHTGPAPGDLSYFQISENEIYTKMATNYVSRYFTYCAKTRSETSPVESNSKRDPISKMWSVTWSDKDFSGTGTGSTKQIAKNFAFQELTIARFGTTHLPNTLLENGGVHKHPLRYTTAFHPDSSQLLLPIHADDKLLGTLEYQPDQLEWFRDTFKEYIYEHLFKDLKTFMDRQNSILQGESVSPCKCDRCVGIGPQPPPEIPAIPDHELPPPIYQDYMIYKEFVRTCIEIQIQHAWKVKKILEDEQNIWHKVYVFLTAEPDKRTPMNVEGTRFEFVEYKSKGKIITGNFVGSETAQKCLTPGLYTEMVANLLDRDELGYYLYGKSDRGNSRPGLFVEFALMETHKRLKDYIKDEEMEQVE